MRSVPEWIAKSDDAAIPDRVKDRVAQKTNECCASCKRPIGGKLRPEYDHIIPLILGGKHAESNLQLLCNECHGLKTKLDVKIKAKVARIRKARVTERKPSRGFYDKTKFKMKIGGGLVDRRTGLPASRGGAR
jgi:5-methylcytosine-specific restriction endonuclease McrA